MNILSLPAIYWLELTSACNNRCPGCGNVYAAERGPQPMPASVWEELLAGFGPEAAQIRLSGGEPTLHPEFFRILDAADSYDARVAIFTNGRWSDPKGFVRRLRDRHQPGGLLVSLHGASASSHEAFTRVRGSFDETVANIRLAVENGIRVSLSTIITRRSWDELEEVVELAGRLGVHHVAFNRYLGRPLPAIEPTSGQMRWAVWRIEELLRDGAPVKYGIGLPQCFEANSSGGCLAGVAYAAVDPWGNVRPCAHSPSVAGSLRRSSLADVWHSEAMNAWRGLMPAECTACAAYAVCHGGCRAVQELRPGRRDPLRNAPLAEYNPASRVRELPADARPRAALRLRPEVFGYALLGQGQVVPVGDGARALIEACDGSATFAQLADLFGPEAVDLLGELWERGMLEAA